MSRYRQLRPFAVASGISDERPFVLPHFGVLTPNSRLRTAVTDLASTARPSFWTGAVELAGTWWGTRVTAAVRNLANTTYYEPMSFIAEPGRQFTVAIRRDLTLPALGIQRKATQP